MKMADKSVELKLLGGEESGTAELARKVMDEMELSVAKMPANIRTRTAKLELQNGEESETAELEREVRKVMDEMEMRVAKLHENGRDKAELKAQGGEESGTAELENKVTDVMELSLANMPANERDGTAGMELQGGEECGTAELGCEVRDEMELCLANIPANERDRTAKLELPGGKVGGTAELGDDSEHNSDRVSFEVQSEFSDRIQEGYESGTAELKDDQYPRPIQHQSKTLGSEKLQSYPSNSGQPIWAGWG